MLLMGPGFNFTRSNISQKDSSIFKKVKPHQGTECGCSQRNMSESRIEVLLEPHTAESNGQKGYINDMFPLHKVKIISTSRRHKISNHLFVGTRCLMNYQTRLCTLLSTGCTTVLHQVVLQVTSVL